jgi:hypothetical protein
MKVVLKHDITGTRNGEPWPPAGSEIDLPEGEALPLLSSGAARAVNEKDADVETRVDLDEATERRVKHDTTTRERQARSKRAHEPLNLAVADAEQPAEDDNGPRAPEVQAEASAKVEDPAQPTQSEDGPTGDKVEVKESGSTRKGAKK